MRDFEAITVLLDDKTLARMRVIASETGRAMEELAEAAVSEAALEYFRHRKDDPATTHMEKING